MQELISKKIAMAYIAKAKQVSDKSLQDTGERRRLRKELQDRCGLTELEAVNIINGRNIKDYIAKYKMLERKR